MVTLIQRELTVGVPSQRAWDHLARVEQWPSWAPHIWDAATGKEVTVLHGHIGYVLCVTYSSDGKRLVSSGGYRAKGDVKIWDVSQWETKDGK